MTGTAVDTNQKTLLQERTDCALQLTRIAGASPGQIKLSVVMNNVKDCRKVSTAVIQGSLRVESMKRQRNGRPCLSDCISGDTMVPPLNLYTASPPHDIPIHLTPAGPSIAESPTALGVLLPAKSHAALGRAWVLLSRQAFQKLSVANAIKEFDGGPSCSTGKLLVGWKLA